MAISRSRAEFLKQVLEHIESDPKPLNDFERSFMGDQKGRFEQYGSSMFMSDKQWAIVTRVGNEKYDIYEDNTAEE